ncbi:myosin-15 isoform X1 [Tanacetum coccineum]
MAPKVLRDEASNEKLDIYIFEVLAFAKKLLLRDADVTYGGVDDMTRLDYLNEHAVLDNLKKYHALYEIYELKGFYKFILLEGLSAAIED